MASSIHRIPQVDNDAELRQLRDQLPVLRQRMPAWANLLAAYRKAARGKRGKPAAATKRQDGSVVITDDLSKLSWKQLRELAEKSQARPR